MAQGSNVQGILSILVMLHHRYIMETQNIAEDINLDQWLQNPSNKSSLDLLVHSKG